MVNRATWERHPVYRMITPAEAMKHGPRWYDAQLDQREKLIFQSGTNPLEHAWEPPIYEVCDALIDMNWFQYGTGLWEETRDLHAQYRAHLGFPEPVTALLMNGGNQIGKTEYAYMRLMRMMLAANRTMWAFHSSEDQSKQAGSHQPGFWRYMPANLKTDTGIKSGKAYVAFKHKTGFSENSFILPNLSSLYFKFYGMDQDRAIQGPNVFGCWLDELFPISWLRDCMFRVAKQNGFVLGTFTPKNGYTPACAWFYEGAEVVKESIAYMLPADGGRPDIARSLGFPNDEAYRLAYEIGEDKRGQTGYGPNSIPEQTRNWLTGKPSQPPVPPGRAFKKMPRVMKCAPIEFDGRMVYNRAVIFLHSADGPFGSPRNVLQAASTQSNTEVMWRVYGYATRMATALLKRFDSHHICKASEIPETGTNYHFMDPAASRNPFQTWIRVNGLDAYVYREWPGNYIIPGVGIPGAWAEPDEKHPDGMQGPAQESFGWGIKRHKQEIARLEGWNDYREDGTGLENWDAANGASELIYERRMDARAASSPKHENNRMSTLLTMFEDVGLYFLPTPADDIQSGVEALNDMLDWKPGEDIDLSQMRLHICEDCTNTVTCARMWTGRRSSQDRSGRVYLGGASKDPIDNIRYFSLSNPVDAGSAALEPLTRSYG